MSKHFKYLAMFILMKKRRLFTRTLVVLLAIFPISILRAEVNCTLNMSYEWEKEGTSKGEGKKGASMTSPEKREEFIRQLKRSGKDEAVVTKELQEQAFSLKREMLRECTSIHENFAGCIASRYRAYSADIRNGGFTARKALESAIQQDCKNLQGRCLGINMSKVACSSPESDSMKKDDSSKSDQKKDEKKK